MLRGHGERHGWIGLRVVTDLALLRASRTQRVCAATSCTDHRNRERTGHVGDHAEPRLQVLGCDARCR